ncbi:MAG TPA: cytochrome c [Rhizobiaceae bacterium]|nr:cytochrome c [Rhizobiaceae bacterium]
MTPTAALAADAAAGKAFVEENCGRCHATGQTGESAHAEAPPFRTLSERYPVDSIAEALAEGIVTGHPDMPQFEVEPDEIENIIAWLSEIQQK